MSSAAARQRHHRERRARGRTVIAVEIDDVRTVEALIATGFLDAADADDRAAVSDALTRMVEALTTASNA